MRLGDGCPPEASDASKPPVAIRVSVAQLTVQKPGAVACRRSASLRKASIATGSRSRIAIARSVCRERPVSTAAAVPFPHTSPTATSQRSPAMSKRS